MSVTVQKSLTWLTALSSATMLITATVLADDIELSIRPGLPGQEIVNTGRSDVTVRGLTVNGKSDIPGCVLSAYQILDKYNPDGSMMLMSEHQSELFEQLHKDTKTHLVAGGVKLRTGDSIPFMIIGDCGEAVIMDVDTDAGPISFQAQQ